MQVTKIGQTADGRALGEDAQGGLYIGKKRQVEWTEITRHVIDNGDHWTIEYRYGDQLHSKANLGKDEIVTMPNGDQVKVFDPDDDPGLKPPRARKIVGPDGKVIEIPRTITVIDWEAL